VCTGLYSGVKCSDYGVDARTVLLSCTDPGAGLRENRKTPQTGRKTPPHAADPMKNVKGYGMMMR